MGGVLTHLTAALISLVIVHLIHFKWEYSWAIFVGNFIPDAIKFGISAVKQGTIAVFSIKQDNFYQFLNSLTSNYAIWFSLGFFILGSVLLLYHYHYIKRKKLDEFAELYVFFVAGIVIHLILDLLVFEKNPWV